MKRTLGTIVALALVLTLAPAAPASDLQTTGGTMQLGGNLTFDIEMDMPEQGDNVTGFKLDIGPVFGYFVIDNLELMAQVAIETGFGDKYENAATNIGFAAGAAYFLDLGGMDLKLGVMIGLNMVSPSEGDSVKWLVIMAPIGIVVPLNQHVGLDLGLRFTYLMGLDDQGSTLQIPIGYLGVSAFF